MKIILIAALNRHHVIGRDGKIPWRIPEDLERFKNLTTHHTVLMGRKTFDSIGKPLLNRKNVVITRHNISSAEIETYSSLETAFANLTTQEKVFVIGGGEIFRQTIDRADELMLTLVDNEETGDTFFPPYEELVGTVYTLQFEEKKEGYQFRNYTKLRN